MKTKTMGTMCVLMVLGVSGAGAVEVKGKWGIGAGVFGGVGEVSLIRGKSERSAWLFDVGISQSYGETSSESTPPFLSSGPNSNRRTISVLAGPGYRRFARPTDTFSPYWDVRVRGLYSRASVNSGSEVMDIESGIAGDFSLGLEYFTPWRFSVAAHSRLVGLAWTHTAVRVLSSGGGQRVIANAETATIGLSPAIFVRGYF